VLSLRMDRQSFCISHIRQMRDEFQGFDELLSRFRTALDSESENRSRAFRQIFFHPLLFRTGLKSRIVDPTDFRMFLQIAATARAFQNDGSFSNELFPVLQKKGKS